LAEADTAHPPSDVPTELFELIDLPLVDAAGRKAKCATTADAARLALSAAVVAYIRGLRNDG
jgi:hypothetical protein